MQIRLSVLLAFAAFFAPQPLLALGPEKSPSEYVRRSWDEETGLPHKLVISVIQTADGYLWLATQGGLVRFDGLSFTVFNHLNTPEITENSIRHLGQTANGSLWISPLRADPIVLHDGGFHVLSGIIPELWRQSGTGLWAQPQSDDVWITAIGGIARLRDGQLDVLAAGRASADLTYQRRATVVDRRGRIWFSAQDGVHRVDGETVTTPILLPGARALRVAGDGSLWIGADGLGVFRYEGDVLVNVPFPFVDAMKSVRVNALTDDPDGNLWVATNSGLYRLSSAGKDGAAVPALAGQQVEDVMVDAKGLLWASTRSGLVQLKDPRFRTFSAAPLQEVLSLVERRDGSIWFVTVQAPYLHRVEQGRLRSYEGPLPGTPRAIFEDRDGRLLLGTTTGLYVEDGTSRWSVVPGSPATEITTVRVDARGSLWLAEAAGDVRRKTDGAWTTFGRSQGLSGHRVESFWHARDGAMWVGTQDGAFRIVGEKVTAAPLAPGAARYVRPIAEDADGAVWIGTRAGLTRFKDGRYDSFEGARGVPDPIMQSIVDDGRGYLWVGSSKGIYRVAKSDFDDLVAQRISQLRPVLYGRRDGISAGQAWGNTGLRAQDGSLWFATTSGVATIPVSRLAADPTPPPVFVEDTVIDKKRYPGNGLAEAPPGERSLIFRFTALDYEAPERLRFRYRLEGFDEEWIDSEGSREARYTRVPPGNYTFRVTAGNNEGSWNTAGAARSIRLAPYLYETSLFRAASLLGIVGLVWGGYRLRVQQGVARERELGARVEERTRELKTEIAAREETQAALAQENAERKAAEAEIAKQGAFLRQVLDLNPHSIFVKDRQRRYVLVNQALADRYGTTPEHLIGRTDADLTTRSDDLSHAIREEEKVLATARESVVAEEQRIDARGSVRWFQSIRRPIRSLGGHVEQLLGVSTDITQRKQAEEEAHYERDLLRALMDNIPDWIYFKDVDSRFTRINRAYAEALKLADPQDAQGKLSAQFFTAEVARAWLVAEQKILKTGEPLMDYVEHVTTQDGYGRWRLNTTVALRDRNGDINGLVGVSKDITDRKEAEAAFERGLLEFEQLVAGVSEGDLSLSAREGADVLGRIGRSVNRMLATFDQMLAQVQDLTDGVASSAAEILTASQHIAAGSRAQTEDIQHTAMTVQDLVASMNEVSRQAQASASAGLGTLETARDGGQTVENTALGMARIDAAVGETASKMQRLAATIARISAVIDLIDDIAAQTNLLSLNAAIEAAHAGQAGAGFSVVAEEIRRLADRSTDATKEVSALTTEMQTETAEALQAMKAGTREVAEGLKLVSDARKALHNIATSVTDSCTLAGEISATSAAQVEVTTELAATMGAVSGVTGETAAAADQTTHTIHALTRLATALKEAVARFKLRGGRSRGRSIGRGDR